MLDPLISSEKPKANSETTTELERSLELVSILFFVLIESIWLGAFGEVRMCVHRESNAQRAVKVLRKSNMDEDEKRMLFNEINILKEIVSHFSSIRRLALLSQFLSWDLPFHSTKFLPSLGSSKYHQDVRVLRGREKILSCHRVSKLYPNFITYP